MPGPRTGLAHDVNARRRGAALGERLANSALSVNVVMTQLWAIICIQVPVMEMVSPVMYRVNCPLRNNARTLCLLDVVS